MTKAVRINGEETRISTDTVEALLRSRDIPIDGRGIAVAVNGTVVPRAEWRSARLEDGDQLEIIRPVVGG